MALTKIPANLLDTSSHVDFANNEKLRFGTGSDLQIYSDGTHSRIYESGSGLLIIRAGGFNINNADGSQSYITMSDGGATTLYHAGAAKLATASGGASVTGNLAVSGNLTVSGTTTELDTTNLNVTDKNITLNYHASNDTSSNADGAGITIQDAVNASTDATFNWGASNDRFKLSHGLEVLTGNVGIGTNNPTSFLSNATALEISGGTGVGSELILTNNSSMSANEVVGSLIFKNTDASGSPNHFAGLRAKAEATYGRMYLEFYAGRSRMEGNTPDMVISPGGADAQAKVAIGSTTDALANMSGLFRILDSTGGDRTVAHFGAHNYGDTGKTFINIGSEYGDGTSRIGSFNDTGNSSVLVFDTHSATSGQFTERMRIDSGGNINVATTAKNNNYPARFITTSLSTPASEEACHILELVGNRTTNAGNQNGMIQFWNNTSTAVETARISGIQGTALNSGVLTFNTYAAGTSAEAMRIDQNGNVGIGQSAPATTLHIGDGASHYVRIENAGSGDVSSGYQIYRGSSVGMSLYDNPADNTTSLLCAGSLNINAGGSGADLHVNTNGKVGIGTSSPTQKLHVAGAKTYVSNIVQGQLQVQDTTSAAAGVGGGILFTGSYSGTTTTAAASIEAAKSNGTGGNFAFDMVFKTRDNGGGAVERARFGADGGDPSYGRLRLTSGYGAFEIGAANSGYFHFQRNTGPSIYYFSNQCQASGGFSTYSDERLKENIVTMTGALDSVAKMNGVTFKWKDAANRGSGDTGKQFGVIAQNMLEVDSELPKLNVDPTETQENIDDASKNTDYYSMDYARITPFLIEAVKELKTKLEAAEARITTLEG